MGLQTRKINWVYDADIQGFFDAIDHEWLVDFIEHRIGDRRVIRHVKKWLKAGVLEDGEWRQTDDGAPQGGSVSPLLANIYLHYALDMWVQRWRKKHAQGEVIIVRYADDFAAGNRNSRGEGKPETFEFLGFSHICSQTRKGKFTIRRQTIGKRLRAKLHELAIELKRRRHWTIPEVGRWLGTVVRGHCQYYGVPGNFALLKAFRQAVLRLWQLAIRCRSQRSRAVWARVYRLAKRWIPYVHIMHPYPSARLRV